jgi:hypothetical protein
MRKRKVNTVRKLVLAAAALLDGSITPMKVAEVAELVANQPPEVGTR